MQKEMKTIREAATALCDRWDTPLWKDAKHTSVLVHELRTALAQPEQEPVADYWVLDDENTFAEEVSFYSFREAKQAASDHGCGLVAYHRTLTRIDAAQPEQEPSQFGSPKMQALILAKLAQPEQEPVLWGVRFSDGQFSPYAHWSKKDSERIALHSHLGTVAAALYTTPPKRDWVELTAEEIHDTEGYKETRELYRFARAVLAKSKEKNA